MPSQATEQTRLLSSDQNQPDTGKNAKPDRKPLLGQLQGIPLYLALAFPNLGCLLVAIDVTITSTVSATIVADFSSLAVISWLGSAYLVASAAIQPISGQLTDRFGRRAGLFFALFCFLVGNLACGFARNEVMLIAGRALAGVGGGAISSITTFITSDLLPLRKRGVWQGIGNMLWAVGMGVGGVIGGAVNDWVGWRWAFIGMTPLTLIIAVGAYFTLLPGPFEVDLGDEPQHPIDYLGIAGLTATLVALTLGLNSAGEDISQLWFYIPLAIAAVVFIAFVIIEVRLTKDPIVPVRLLADRSVLCSCLSGLLTSASMHTLLFYVPLAIQVRGYSSTETGVQLLGEPLGASWGSFLVGVVMQVVGGYGLLKPVVYLVYIAAPLGYFLSNLDTPAWVTVLCLVAMGAGFGGVLTVIMQALLANTEQRVQAKATGMMYAFRQVGASSGLAFSGLLFRAQVPKYVHRASLFFRNFSKMATATQTSHAIGGGIDNIADQCSRQHFPSGSGRPQICVAYGQALHDVFLLTLVLGAAGLICGMLIRNVPLDRDDHVYAAITETAEASEAGHVSTVRIDPDATLH